MLLEPFFSSVFLQSQNQSAGMTVGNAINVAQYGSKAGSDWLRLPMDETGKSVEHAINIGSTL